MPPSPSPWVVPQQFYDAALDELQISGYYREKPEIEVRVDGDFIDFISTSRIIAINGEASIYPPGAQPPKGLKLVDEIYQIDGAEFRATRKVRDGSHDRYYARFRRKNSKVIQVTDTHYWLSPVTSFAVTFRYGNTHSCGVEKLTGRIMGLAPEPNDGKEAGRIIYRYPSASFAGQGFTWWVRWLS